RRAKHDALLSEVHTTSRSEIGAVTNLGRVIRFSPIDLPVVPESSVSLAAGRKAAEYIGIDPRREKVLALISSASETPMALGTRQGVVKRLSPGEQPNRPDFEVIARKPGDGVVGAAEAADDVELVFVTSDAQLLRFGAS